MSRLKRYHLFGLFLFTLILFNSCRKENFYSGKATLTFDTDTVYFDTVFTKLPGSTYPRSINKQFVLRNPYKDHIKTSIRLAGGIKSPYRMNVDGISTTDLKDYEIRPEDSIFIFVECTLEPNNLTQPALVMDSILITTNDNIQQVKLAAYGWDAYYYRDSVLQCNEVWDKTDKPYVIVSSVAVNTDCKLEIKQGVNIYASNDSKIYVLGTLKVDGTKNEPVLFRADRLDRRFEDAPGQWIGIHFFRFSKDNEIRHALIKNAVNGIRVDSLSINNDPKLSMYNTQIQNCSSIGLLGITSDIVAENCVVTNCGAYTFLGYYGGNYDLRHCTFANYNLGFIRNDPQFVLNNIQFDENDQFVRDYDIRYNIQNCIIYGSNDEEMGFDISANNLPKIANIQGCMIRTEFTDLAKGSNQINRGHSNVPFFKDLLFEDYRSFNYELDSLSTAKDSGVTLVPPILKDFAENPRDAKPDIGAFESLYK